MARNSEPSPFSVRGLVRGNGGGKGTVPILRQLGGEQRGDQDAASGRIGFAEGGEQDGYNLFRGAGAVRARVDEVVHPL